MADLNVFCALSTYSGSCEENYLTEALAFLLRELLTDESGPALRLLNCLCGLTAPILPGDDVIIRTQVTYDEARVDMEVRAGGEKLAWIEVKDRAGVSLRQLGDYRERLDKQPYPNRSLALLSRSRYLPPEIAKAQYHNHHVCWYEIWKWLDDPEIKHPLAEHYVRAFRAFLKEKRMSLNQVTPEYVPGIEALVNLTAMIEAAIREIVPHPKLRLKAGWTWRGLYFGELWCGVRFDAPLTVVFENHLGYNPTYKHDLDLKAVGFFRLSKDEQFERLVDFVRTAWADFEHRPAEETP